MKSQHRHLRVSCQCLIAIAFLVNFLPDCHVLSFVPLQYPSSFHPSKEVLHDFSIPTSHRIHGYPLKANKKPIQDGGKNKRISLSSFTFPLKQSVQTNRSLSRDKKSTIQDDKKKYFSLPTITISPQVIENIQNILSKIAAVFPTVRTIVLSFVAGAFITATSIFVPIYQSMDSLSQPVALFETILSDLDRAYVDKVDTNKLFETGVQAMLRSLDPYTEFEGKTEAQELSESVSGKYGGIGLVISGPALPKAVTEAISMDSLSNNDPSSMDRGNGPLTSSDRGYPNDLNYDGDTNNRLDSYNVRKEIQKARDRGIRVVSAFEGYAFDYGLRTGDKIIAIDGVPVDPLAPAKSTTAIVDGSTNNVLVNVEQVRNKLRGEPGSEVQITFVRDGVSGENTVTVPRTVVQIRDVKLAALVGNPQDRIGYIQLTGFSANAGRDMRNAIHYLQNEAIKAQFSDTNSNQYDTVMRHSSLKGSLKGLILDLRSNPGGLLTSAVDVSSLFVPKDSDIVSARGRGFPGVLYRSKVDPMVDPTQTKVAVLVNGQTASAAEIVSGAIQDLDVGVIVGSDRTFGKGLVQNVQDLPFDTALKFTVAKYYTPSGRCIQSTKYEEGEISSSTSQDKVNDGRYQATKVSESERMIYFTKNGRKVRDGGGIEADVKVDTSKASALEVTLLRSNVLSDFAAEWSKTHELNTKSKNAEIFEVDEATYQSFQRYAMKKNQEGDFKLDALYSGPLKQLQDSLKKSGYGSLSKEVEHLEGSILQEMQRDFVRYKNDIMEDIENNILARYLPESMLIERSLRNDKQVLAAASLLKDIRTFDTLLARSETTLQPAYMAKAGEAKKSIPVKKDNIEGASVNINW